MKKIKLNNEIFIDEDKFVSSGRSTMTLLQASTGGGKSWAIRRILEQSFGKFPQIVLDTEGEFSTLREKHDYILIGKDYDISADPKTAGLMALRLWEEGVSAIIDLYELSPWDKQLFVKNFVDAMINAPKKLWNPVLLVIDEAHEYAPEGDRTDSGRALHLLASKGRKRDIGVIFATQRIATLSKNVVAACKNKLIGYTSLMNDMKRANDELGFSPKDLELRKLDPGEFFAFGPAISREIIKFKIGEVETTHGNHGAKSAKVAPASEKVKKALARLADLPQEAKKEADTIASLQTEIKELKAKLRDNPQKIVETDIKFVEKEIEEGILRHKIAFDSVINAYKNQIQRWKDHVDMIRNFVNSMTIELRDLKEPSMEVGVSYNPSIAKPKDIAKEVKTIQKINNSSQKVTIHEGISGPEQKILNAIAWFHSIGNTEPNQTAVAFLAGYTYGGGGFNNPRGSLRTKGLVEYRGEKIALTNEGSLLAQTPIGQLTQEELHEKVLNILPGPERKLLAPLLVAYPDPVSNEWLAEQSGYKNGSGGFNNPKGRLRSLGLIEYPSAGQVVAKSLLFI